MSGGRRGRNRNRRGVHEDINLHFHYSWNPPTIGFKDLQNVVVESTKFVLQPSVSSSRPFSEFERLEIDHIITPVHDHMDHWLQWDEANACYRGTVPYSLAPTLGTQRLDSYTLALELTTKVTKRFPGGIAYETLIRCALPLTVKRQPDECIDRYRAMYKFPSPLKSMAPLVPHHSNFNVQVRMVRDVTLHSDVQQGLPLPQSPRRASGCGSPIEDVRYSTPCRDMGSTKVNRRGELGSDSNGGSPDPTPRAVSILLSPEKANFARSPTFDCRNNKYPTKSPNERSPEKMPHPFRNKNDRSLQWYLENSAEASSSSTSGRAAGRDGLKDSPNFEGSAKNERAERFKAWVSRNSGKHRDHKYRGKCEDHSRSNKGRKARESGAKASYGTPEHSPDKSTDLTEDDEDAWQNKIQRNYQEFLEDKENLREKFDFDSDSETMQAEAWSDEE